ncbi:MAG TPA: DUF72 domain-containing protein [Vitreimonas sp.]|uniref:DUF72 domain-containing protein n=1 Tax=Vitreimonas sp. TaxID=3069702 RepID=UPI002D452D36|nr:DUF72 domain-containing protein [Vitreimonas sp.]HYD87856.1 DUF72 domain-containing protein [Vitreimonas sp.]
MIRVGIGGWNYEPWEETFYPADLAKAKQLEYAASKVTAIEINATFYRTQSAASFKKWAAATPDGFKFSVKAPRAAVQRKDLREAAQSVEWFFNSGVGELGSKLGPIFWQMAPYKKFDAAEMNAYFDLLPEKLGKQKLQHAIEVRHASFACDEFMAMARARNVAVVTVESEKHPLIVEPTADFAYARLELTQADEPTGYSKAALKRWAKTAREWEKSGEVYLYFISGAKERNPAAAQAMLEILKA